MATERTSFWKPSRASPVFGRSVDAMTSATRNGSDWMPGMRAIGNSGLIWSSFWKRSKLCWLARAPI